MFEGVISLILSYMVKILLQPLFNQYTEIALERGYSLESLETPLTVMEMVIQTIAFLVVFFAIKAIKYIITSKH